MRQLLRDTLAVFLETAGQCAGFTPAGRGAGLAGAVLLITGSALAHEVTLRGQVALGTVDRPAHRAEVTVVETAEVVHTDDEGRFEIRVSADEHPNLTLLVEIGGLSARRPVALDHDRPEQELESAIVVDAPRFTAERITVTASAVEVSNFEAFSSVSSLSGFELQREGTGTPGSLLEGLPGVAFRSMGPASGRPIIRGFDGDRVLILEDGIGTGDVSSMSPDHSVPVDPSQAERIEVVRGPATLLYGSSAIGGAVNVISMAQHLAHAPPPGFRGQASLAGSSADESYRGGTRFQVSGDGWFAWGGGNASRAGDYTSPEGPIENSSSRLSQGEVGLGLFAGRAWFAVTGKLDDSRFGVPFHVHPEEEGEHHEEEGEHHEEEEEGEHHDEEEDGHGHGHEDAQVDLDLARRQLRADFGLRDLDAVFDAAEVNVRYVDYEHDEVEVFPDGDEILATRYDNRSIVFRGELKKTRGDLHSRLGVWGNLREFANTGAEALAPEVRQNAFAAFTYNEIRATDRLDLLFGGRVERNSYETGERPIATGHDHGEEEGHEEEEGHDEGEEEHHDEDEGEHHDEREPPPLRDRNFLGASGSVGARLALTDSESLVGTVSYATRAPALEELYNFGLHLAVNAFEIGNPDLEAEQSLGFELGLRRRTDTSFSSLNLFRYSIADFIFGVAGNERQDGLPILDFLQTDARYQGFDLEHTNEIGPAHLRLTASYVDAKRTDSDEYLPRIPPLSGKAELTVPVGGLRIAPAVRWAAAMDRLYPGETATDGYAVFDLTASYLFLTARSTHNVSIRGYNLTDTVYRYHTSLIKDLASQIGRGFRVSYSIRFF